MKRHSGEKSSKLKEGSREPVSATFCRERARLVEATFSVKVMWRRRRMKEKEWNKNEKMKAVEQKERELFERSKERRIRGRRKQEDEYEDRVGEEGGREKEVEEEK